VPKSGVFISIATTITHENDGISTRSCSSRDATSRYAPWTADGTWTGPSRTGNGSTNDAPWWPWRSYGNYRRPNDGRNATFNERSWCTKCTCQYASNAAAAKYAAAK
jgi:hypothetical protein